MGGCGVCYQFYENIFEEANLLIMFYIYIMITVHVILWW